MSCRRPNIPKDATQQLASIVVGSGPTAPSVTAIVKVPSCLIKCTLAIFPRFTSGAIRPETGSSAAWNLQPQWPIGKSGSGGLPAPLRSVYTAPQSLPDAYEILSGAKEWLITATLSLWSSTPGNGQFLLGAVFEPADSCMSNDEWAYWRELCLIEVPGSGNTIVNGAGEAGEGG